MASKDVQSLAEGLGNLSMGAPDQPTDVSDKTIEINYASSKNVLVRRKNIVESILADKDVILFGEGDFTFSFALAAIRGGWSRIVSTQFKPATTGLLPTFDSVKQKCVINCLENGELLDIEQDKIKENIKIIMSLTAPAFALCGIDATKSFVEGKVAWFQCPWVSLSDTTAKLIIDFLNNMAVQQRSGDYVLIGITTCFPYVNSYNLGDLLDFTRDLPGSPLKIASRNCLCRFYNFKGADDSFIKKILQFGYRHQGVKDIHNTIFEDHITLIFKRNEHK